MNISDIDGTKSRRLFLGEPKHLMDKYATVEKSQPRAQTKSRLRGYYDHMDYRDVTKAKAANLGRDQKNRVHNQGSRESSMTHNHSSGYLDQYNRILVESQRERKDPLSKIRNSVNYDSNSNQAARSVQEYLSRSRRKQERKLPFARLEAKSTSPDMYNRNMGKESF
jgi:hypothetical protein